MTRKIAAVEGFTISRVGDAQLIRFDRPKSANAMTVDMMQALSAAIASSGTDPMTKCIILTGAPGRHFSAGADLGSELSTPASRTRGRNMLCDLLLAIVDCERPVVSAVNGAAIGAGAMIALVSDAAIAAENVSFGFPEIDIGMPSPLAIALLTQIAGASVAHDLVLSGRRIDGPQSLDRGLIAGLCPLDELQTKALARSSALGKKPAAAFVANKRYSRRLLRQEIIAACGEAQRLQDAAPDKT